MKTEGGKRILGNDKVNYQANLPVVSIITIVWNSEKLIANTIENILNQTYPNVEYIIIDGASSDSTLDIIKSYDERISYWVSEKDKGLYDAMNKGIQAATGEYIWFINSGDSIYEKDSLAKSIVVAGDVDIIYGDTMFTDELYNDLGTRDQFLPHKVPEKLKVSSLHYGMAKCHQSFIVKKNIAPLYDLKYKISADFNWQISCVKNAKTNYNTHAILSRFLVGGLSRQHLKKSLKERANVMIHHFGYIQTFLSHIMITIRGVLFFGIKRGGKI